MTDPTPTAETIRELSQEAALSGDIPMCIICDIALLDLPALRERADRQTETDEEAGQVAGMSDLELLLREAESAGLPFPAELLTIPETLQAEALERVADHISSRKATWALQVAASERVAEALSDARAQEDN